MDALAELLARPAAFVALCAILGLVVGSFLNVVIHRLPKMLERQWQRECAELKSEAPDEAPRYNLIVPASACPGCNHRIRALENLPVLSYLALRGRCSACGMRIPVAP
jgi:leader peptidase (prepilin peptidase)/N-methyltransferase